MSLALILGLSVVFYTLKTGISPSPTSSKVRDALLNSLPSDFKGTIYELGSGWGTLLFPLAKRYPECQVIGYELSPLPYLVSLSGKWILRRNNLTIYRRNFLKQNFKEDALFICYLYRGGMRKLNEVLPSDSRVVTHTFALPSRKPTRVQNVLDSYRTTIYHYSL